jgi:hypothetical protein
MSESGAVVTPTTERASAHKRTAHSSFAGDVGDYGDDDVASDDEQQPQPPARPQPSKRVHIARPASDFATHFRDVKLSADRSLLGAVLSRITSIANVQRAPPSRAIGELIDPQPAICVHPLAPHSTTATEEDAPAFYTVQVALPLTCSIGYPDMAQVHEILRDRIPFDQIKAVIHFGEEVRVPRLVFTCRVYTLSRAPPPRAQVRAIVYTREETVVEQPVVASATAAGARTRSRSNSSGSMLARLIGL